ncbi:MAG: hypothetical protein KDD47_05980, partial [Acidobacteria bacterium]|nr:hypothetical protein [Acidobacteriota bacterium]
MSKILVFAGPTLASAEGSRALALPRGLELRPPAQRGDVLNALCDEPDVLVLLDGYYYSVPAVTHKEILYALESGVRVIGASSMGALRAAELLPYGMEGVGRIFELFRDGVLDGDDEVALLHASEEFGYRPLTVALVDLREAASQLVADGEATQEAAAALIAEVKAWPFKERFSRRIERRAVEELGGAAARRLTALLAGGGLKARDAEQAMALASSPPSSPRSAPPPGTATTFLGYFHEWHLKVPGGEDEDAPSFLEAWNMLRIFHPEAEAFVTRLRHRFLLATACRQRGEEPPADRVDEIAEVLRQSTIGGFRRPLLPRRELRLEAEDQALAEGALLAPGGAPEVLSELAVGLGLPARGGLEKIEELLGIQDDL